MTAACAWLAYLGLLSWWWIAVPISALVVLLVWHDRVIRAGQALARAIVFYERGIARIEDRWADSGETGQRFLDHDDNHPYARDLDLFGSGSLFQFLSLARTHAGEDTLAAWLKAPAAIPDLRQRQEAVAELRDRLDFREALATTGGEASDIDTTALTAWASASPVFTGIWARAAAVALAIAIVATAAWWSAGGSSAPLILAMLLKAAFARPFHHRVARVTRGIERPLRQLDVLAGILTHIEQEQVTSHRLAGFRTQLKAGRLLPSLAIQRLHRLSELLDWERNMIFAPIRVISAKKRDFPA